MRQLRNERGLGGVVVMILALLAVWFVVRDYKAGRLKDTAMEVKSSVEEMIQAVKR